MRKPKFAVVKFDKMTPGGQALGELESGKKIFAWGVLPGELAKVQITKSKSSFAEGFAVEILETSSRRIVPQDPESYLSTSPWQVMDFDFEQQLKQELVTESFAQEKISIKPSDSFFTDNQIFGYRNKIEFSFWWENSDQNPNGGELNLAFFRRGGKGKVPVRSTSLTKTQINRAGQKVLDLLRQRLVSTRDLKTLLIRCNQNGNIAAQLYVKEEDFELFSDDEVRSLGFLNFEIIYSNPKSPASVITKVLFNSGGKTLSDKILNVNFNYVTEGFFQINLPVYEQALKDMSRFIDNSKPTTDLYSGVGSIGLTIGENDLTMVEINSAAVKEMERNIKVLGREGSTQAILAASENALEYISAGSNLIVDPPRAGMDKKVCQKILDTKPSRIIYLSCNPSTQARDVAMLSEEYKITYSRGYNFFPRTPHIENLVVLDLNSTYTRN
ncbi:class I SAM-dependent RNA methyltransferase [Candidatus Saccharibacteria bacterium]|nr:class I SAM-dependent RNA methyltransferase [Candidatus Saccharibacteria bacterium]